MEIPMDYFVSSGIRFESIDSFKSSFFTDVYRQALETIALIIHTNHSKNEYVDKSKKKNIEPIYDVQNTIAFTGRRGTGKTSAMVSVRNCLLGSDDITLDLCDGFSREELQRIQFWTIPKMVDASQLDEKEDLLEIILACMLKELSEISSDRDFNEREYGQKVEDLKLKITKVQNNYDSLIQTNGHTIPASYTMLIQGADKHYIQSEFKKIVDDYLLVLSECRSNNDKTKQKEKCLVICIDDIDMYPGDPMQIMQCIYRYFSIPNILVMTSWNYEMLYQYIFNHYYKRTALKNKYEKNDNSSEFSKSERLCHEQSHDYLRKIIPFDKRIVMPSWKKSDYRELTDKIVRLYDKNEFEKAFQSSFPNLYPGRLYEMLKHKVFYSDEKTISIKQLIFIMLADRTGIYLDPCGYKSHFMEPDGLRSTFELFDTLYAMHNIRINQGLFSKYNDDDNKERIRQNYKILLDTFYFKLLPSFGLTDDESVFFDRISKEKISRRGKAIIDFYSTMLEKNSSRKMFFYESTVEDYSNNNNVVIKQDYSIGELFRVLHHSTRLNVFSKDLVKAILASYSFTLPYYFDEGTFDDTNVGKGLFSGDKFKTLFRIFGDSLLGNWLYEMFEFKEVHIILKMGEKWYIDSLKERFNMLINILMFIRLDTLKEIKEVVFFKKNNTYEMSIPVDPTAFIINAIRFDEFSDEINRLISNSSHYTSYSFSKFEDMFEERRRAIFSFFQYGKFYKMNRSSSRIYKRYPVFSLPMHQVDLVYNVIKRSVKDIMYISDSELRIKSFDNNGQDHPENKCIEKFYQNIVKYLTRTKDHYPVYIDEMGTNDNIFVEKFVGLGKGLGLWNSKRSSEEKSHSNGDYTINLKITDYCDFTRGDMPTRKKEKQNQIIENGNPNETVHLVDLLDIIFPDLLG